MPARTYPRRFPALAASTAARRPAAATSATSSRNSPIPSGISVPTGAFQTDGTRETPAPQRRAHHPPDPTPPFAPPGSRPLHHALDDGEEPPAGTAPVAHHHRLVDV